MLFVSTTQEGQPPQVLGAIGCMRLRPVTDYVWLRPFEEHYQVEVVFRDYSRWSEPASTVPFAGAVFAHSWLNFIGA